MLSFGILEGLSGHYTLTNPNIAAIFLTTSYAGWTFLLGNMSFGVLYVGRKIIKILENANTQGKTRKSIQKSLALVSFSFILFYFFLY